MLASNLTPSRRVGAHGIRAVSREADLTGSSLLEGQEMDYNETYLCPLRAWRSLGDINASVAVSEYIRWLGRVPPL